VPSCAALRALAPGGVQHRDGGQVQRDRGLLPVVLRVLQQRGHWWWSTCWPAQKQKWKRSFSDSPGTRSSIEATFCTPPRHTHGTPRPHPWHAQATI